MTTSITKTYPTLDCVVLNSGIQQTLNFTQPAGIDLGRVQQELTTNYTSYIFLLTHLLPHLQSLAPRPAAIVAVSSGLAVVPLPRCANYCASKAALHSLMWSMRAQLAADKEKSGHIRVVEVLPPAVQTELHGLQEELRARGPTDFGMPIEEFTEECWAGLVRADEEVPVGVAREMFIKGEDEKRKAFEDLVKWMGTT